MTVEPTVWRETPDIFAPWVSAAEQSITGLSNGNFLLLWTEFSDTLAPAPFADVVGQIYDALGNPVSGVLNLGDGILSSGSERGGQAAARDDGGFVVSYVSTLPPGFDVREAEIAYGVFNAAGERIGGGRFADDLAPDDVAGPARIAVGEDNDFLLAYQLTGPVEETIRGRIFDANGSAVTSLLNLRNDGSAGGSDTEDPLLTEVIARPGGGYVLLYSENEETLGGPERTIEVRAVGATGGVSPVTNVSTPDGVPDNDPAGAATEDGFVFAWEEGGRIVFRLFDETLMPVGAERLVDTSGAVTDNEPVVVGLQGGGFFVAWDNDAIGASSMRGRRFDETGAPVGGVVEIFDGFLSGPDLGLTSDGRILAIAESFTLAISILDPRESAIMAAPSHGGVTTGRQDGSVIVGLDTPEKFFGVGGDDRIDAGGGNDTVFGGEGDDRLFGRDGDDTVDGGNGADRIYGDRGEDIVRGGNGADRIGGGHRDDLLEGGKGNDRMFGHTGSDRAWGGDGRDVIFGNEGADRLGGDAKGDTIFGGSGDDRLWGGGSGDSLHGNSGNDRIEGGAGADNIRGGAGRDTIDGGAGFDTLRGDGDADVFLWAAPQDGVRDVVLDFDPTEDILRFDAGPGASAAIRDAGRDTRVIVEGQVVVLLGIDPSELDRGSVDLV